ncbi:MAG: hypothetical protein MUW56_09445 [Chryseobacterium sp.]|uniref:hypothetical protein n=1 Tax=Chryseobacterium sp. TaxID=1871047 RepID=UPI0025B8E6A5|nr:hypothetical protein [Chryseobacterium sp.]MCJ7933841.1 hypothetical protein [Chryseobacterium sp.]
MENNEINKYRKFMLYEDGNTYMFENTIGLDQITVSINDHDIYIQYNKLKRRIPFQENQSRVFNDFVLGNYYIKNYYHDKSLLYSKFIWKNKELKKFNFQTKYGFVQFKKINKIEQVQGIAW